MNILLASLLVFVVGCVSTPTNDTRAQIKVDCEIPLSDEQEKHFSDYDRKLFKAIDLKFAETMEPHFSKPRIPFALIQFKQHMGSGLIDDIQVLNNESTLFETQCHVVVASVSSRFRSVPVSGIHGDHRTVTIKFHYPESELPQKSK